ncbi:MAG TPA: multiheme c-type cytochrome, partial [Vicinamibacteria bacterium]
CSRCHPEETALWRGSHHDLAMQEARADTVLGSFDETVFAHDGSSARFFRRDGKFLVESDGKEYEVAYTFGVEPLQQYLLRFPGGRLQALTVAWDTRPKAQGGERWFDLYPDERIAPGDPLHWTGRLQNWNLMCAECHSTNLTKNYHFETDAYGTTWSEPNVSCEACHGPGSQHVRWGEEPEGRRTAENGLVLDLSDRDAAVWSMDLATGLSKRDPARRDRTEIETCGRCHSRRSAEGADYRHGRPLLDTHRVSFLEDTLYYSDGQMLDEVYNYGSFLESKMYASGVTCKDCHEPHGLRVRGEASSVCLACHASGKFDSPSHHFHEPGTAGASCVECHMPATTYMVVDPRHDHSFRVPRPDLSTSLGVPNACNGCHRDRSPQWAASAIEKWYGGNRPPHFGEALDAGRRRLPGADSRLAALVKDSGTPGIVRATALEMLRGSPSPDAIAAIAAGARDVDPLVRLGALEGAALLDPGVRHPLAVPLLSDPVRHVRMEAARLLAEVPTEFFTPDQRPAFDRALEEYRQAQLRNADWPESHMNLA